MKEASIYASKKQNFFPLLNVIVYVKSKPTFLQFNALEKLDIQYDMNCYTPPFENHP